MAILLISSCSRIGMDDPESGDFGNQFDAELVVDLSDYEADGEGQRATNEFLSKLLNACGGIVYSY